MSRTPHMLGNTMADAVKWTWNRGKMRFEATHGNHDMLVHFHKVGGRWSRTLPDGTATHGAGSSYWTYQVDSDHSPTLKFTSADKAKDAAVEEYKARFTKAKP